MKESLRRIDNVGGVQIWWNWSDRIGFWFPTFLITPFCCFHCELTSARFALIIPPTMNSVHVLYSSPLILYVCVCVSRCSSTNTLSWRWCQTVSWIFTASSQGSNTLMWTPPTSKPMMAAKSTKQRIKVHQWRADLCHWGETFSCFMSSFFTSKMFFW